MGAAGHKHLGEQPPWKRRVWRELKSTEAGPWEGSEAFY